MAALATTSPTSLPTPVPVAERQVARSPHMVLEVSNSAVPVILRGFVRDWPMVQAALASDAALLDYLRGFNIGAVVPVSVGSPALKGRLFYNEDFTGLNAERGNARFETFLAQLAEHGGKADPPVIYMASMGMDEVLPGLRAANDVDFGALDPLASIWIGTRTRIAAHNDLPLNIACVAAGKRRFTLFPPDQTANLYPGPFELTPAGRPISLVDFHAPDLDRYPRFADAMATAQVADLEPGDAVFIPSMWWHHVEAMAGVNVLVNYWWRTVPKYLGTPQDVLSHAMLTLRDMPPAERAIWRDIFDHYVFGNAPDAFGHIPERIRGILNPIDEAMARRVRGFLAERLKR